MAKNPGVEVKRFELAELASKALKMALTPCNIKVGLGELVYGHLMLMLSFMMLVVAKHFMWKVNK